ncbi:Hypothetical predicted protein [Podarcis lilfordi]|uniref:Uncharacterized protein n=1 Tax=Podarcis lilfordi TaxID=74358 RepID=A0AA35P6A2_9SAUR|nr:Hypothetical predicted protein [Podarcis lilfordi]
MLQAGDVIVFVANSLAGLLPLATLVPAEELGIQTALGDEEKLRKPWVPQAEALCSINPLQERTRLISRTTRNERWPLAFPPTASDLPSSLRSHGTVHTRALPQLHDCTDHGSPHVASGEVIPRLKDSLLPLGSE